MNKNGSSFLAELRRRKVLQAAAIYGAVAWGVTEVVVTVTEQLFLPQWVSTLAVAGFVVGFPVAMFLAWTFDLTRDGLRRTEVSSRRGKASIALSFLLLIAGTGGLFFLIKPALQERQAASESLVVVPNSIAVLTFENAGMDPTDAYLSEGLSDELRDQLGGVTGIRMAARSSSRAVTARGLDAMEASARLGVAHVVEGSVRRRGVLLRVSVQLIDSRSGLALWSETYDRGPNELLQVQQAITEAVIAQLLPDAGPERTPAPATRDPTANELLLLARFHEQKVREREDVDVDALQEAIRLYREAIAADPQSALAHSRLAGALLYLGDVDAAEAPIFRALSIDPKRSEVQNTLGEFYYARGLINQAGAAWTQAVELNPNNPDALSNYAVWVWSRINAVEAGKVFRRAFELDPLNLERHAEYGSFLALQSHWDEALQIVRQAEERFEGAAAYRAIGQLWAFLGDVDKAIAWTIRARDAEPGNPAHVYKLAEYFADLGDAATALKLDPGGIGIMFKLRRYEEMIDLAEFAVIEEPGSMRLRVMLAVAYNAVGRYESALHILSDTGLPESYIEGVRSNEEIDGFNALVNALYGSGEIELARELSTIFVDRGHHMTSYWWINLPTACSYAILGRDDEAWDLIARAGEGRHLAWEPILRDLPCLQRFVDDPVYRGVVEHYDARRAMLRERLPATLVEFGLRL